MAELNWLQKPSATHKLFDGEFSIGFAAVLWTHQAIGVVAHVPERDEGQCDPTSVCSRNLVLTSHYRRHCPPVIQNGIALLQIQNTTKTAVHVKRKYNGKQESDVDLFYN